jgi:hypothetical protein
MHPMCCAACRHSISELYASVDECFQAMEAMMNDRYGELEGGVNGRTRTTSHVHLHLQHQKHHVDLHQQHRKHLRRHLHH